MKSPLKFVGSKRRLVPDLTRLAPAQYERLVEPFAGGAALTFALEPDRVVLSDANQRLMHMYAALAQDPDGVADELSKITPFLSEAAYYEARRLFNEVDCGLYYAKPRLGAHHAMDDLDKYVAERDQLEPGFAQLVVDAEKRQDFARALAEKRRSSGQTQTQVAALMQTSASIVSRLEAGSDVRVNEAALLLYLNRTCYSGLYRENSSGHFNVPWGKYKRPAFPTRDDLRAAGALLRRAHIYAKPYDQLGGLCRSGDWVYLDPPYLSSFTSYTSQGCKAVNSTDQYGSALATWARSLQAKGCHVMVSNLDTPEVRSWYRGWYMHPVKIKHTVRKSKGEREPVQELIITSYQT